MAVGKASHNDSLMALVGKQSWLQHRYWSIAALKNSNAPTFDILVMPVQYDHYYGLATALAQKELGLSLLMQCGVCFRW